MTYSVPRSEFSDVSSSFSTTFHSPLRPVNNYLRDYLSSPSFLLYSSDKAPHSDEQSP